MSAHLSRNASLQLPSSDPRGVTKVNRTRANSPTENRIRHVVNVRHEQPRNAEIPSSRASTDEVQFDVHPASAHEHLLPHTPGTLQPEQAKLAKPRTPRAGSRSHAPEPEAHPFVGFAIPTPRLAPQERDESPNIDSCVPNMDEESIREDPQTDDIEDVELAPQYFVPYRKSHRKRQIPEDEPSADADPLQVFKILERLASLSSHTTLVRRRFEEANRDTKVVLRDVRTTRRRINQERAQLRRIDTYMTFARKLPSRWSYNDLWGWPIPMTRDEYGDWEEIDSKKWPAEGKGCGEDKPRVNKRKAAPDHDAVPTPSNPHHAEGEVARPPEDDDSEASDEGVKDVPQAPISIFTIPKPFKWSPLKRRKPSTPPEGSEPQSKRRRLCEATVGDGSDEQVQMDEIPAEVISQVVTFIHCYHPEMLEMIAGRAYGTPAPDEDDESLSEGEGEEAGRLFADEDIFHPRPVEWHGEPPSWHVDPTAHDPVEPVREGQVYIPAFTRRELHPDWPEFGLDAHKYRKKLYFAKPTVPDDD